MCFILGFDCLNKTQINYSEEEDESAVSHTITTQQSAKVSVRELTAMMCVFSIVVSVLCALVLGDFWESACSGPSQQIKNL